MSPAVEHRFCVAAATAVFLLGAVLRVVHLGDVRQRTPDEQVYTIFAGKLVDSGPLRGERLLAESYLAHPEMRLYPPPTRIGYFGISAVLMRLTGSRGLGPGEWISCLSSIGGLAITMAIGWRAFSPWTGILGGLLLAVYPPDLALARRVWTDSLADLSALLMIGSALAVAAAPRKWNRAVFVLAGAYSLLVKESSALIFGVCAIWTAWVLFKQHGWTSARQFLAISAAGCMAAAVILAVACGGGNRLADIIGGIPAANAANPYARDFASGPGYRLLLGFWTMGPAVSLLALGGIAVALTGMGGFRDARPARAIAGFTLLFGLLPMFLPNWLNLRYASAVFAPLCLLSGAAVVAGWDAASRHLPQSDRVAAGVLASVCIVVIVLGSYGTFRKLCVEEGLADLSIRSVLGAAER